MKKAYLLIIIFIIVLFLGLFYWFQYRPSRIRANCASRFSDEVRKRTGSAFGDSESNPYVNCLHKYGLKE